jgi:hypothetical protein
MTMVQMMTATVMCMATFKVRGVFRGRLLMPTAAMA